MQSPKSFYRELDALLAKIGKNKKGENFLTSIFVELCQNFGYDIGIAGGMIFEFRDTEYTEVFSTHEFGWHKRIPTDSLAIHEVLEHGSYIYDTPDQSSYFGADLSRFHIVPAAIKIASPEKQWLLVFGLTNNWIREEVTLYLNAVQTALNYRLFSDKIGGELEQAVEIQKSLLPKKSPKFEGYDIYGRSIPAELVGGDFYEYFSFDEGNFGVSIGDASGHGLPAALLVRDVVIGLRMGLAGEFKLVYTLKKLNKVIQQSTYSTNFVSLFIGEMELDGHFFYVNAGHPPPFLVTENKILELKPTGMVLGFVTDIKLRRSYAYMTPGSVLVMYTDGIIERNDGTDNQFTIEKLHELVLNNQQLTAREIVDIIFKTVHEYGHSANWEDDVTVVVIKMIHKAEPDQQKHKQYNLS
jgi:sigma-B regulation protein RsbU (phosphoserine phosphatase)